MVQILFDPSTTHLTVQQTGEGFYEGRLFQRGRGFGPGGRHHGEGVGSVLRGVWKFIKPFALGAAKTIGQEGIDAGGRILTNIAQGANLGETIKTEGKEGVRRVLDQASRKFSQQGSGLPRNKKNIKNKTLAHPKVILKPEDILVGKSVAKSTAIKKRAKSDNLGLY